MVPHPFKEQEKEHDKRQVPPDFMEYRQLNRRHGRATTRERRYLGTDVRFRYLLETHDEDFTVDLFTASVVDQVVNSEFFRPGERDALSARKGNATTAGLLYDETVGMRVQS